MKIVITSITFEGIMRNKKDLLVKLRDIGHAICIVAPSSSSTDGCRELGFDYYPIAIASHGKNPLNDYGVYRQYLKLYKMIKPDLVLALTIKPNVYSGFACRRLGIPYIGTINGIGDAIFNGGILSALTLCLLKNGLKKAEAVFFQNKTNRQLFIDKGIVKAEDAYLVPGSGININQHPYEEYPLSTEPVVLIFIGRMSKDKGIRELIEASRILKEKGLKIVINLVGACSGIYKDMVDSAVKDGLVNCLGKVEPHEIHKILTNSHAVLLPSYHEGIANVLLEGGAAGRPIIATFAEGCEETFDDGISGIGFKPRDVDSLLQAIEKFLNMTNEERKIMGLEAHKKIIREFDRNIVDDAYMKRIQDWEKNK